MANYANIKATIDTQIKQNGNEEITGPVLNSVLNAMVTTIGAGYQYAGVATPSTNPGSPDNRVFYIAATAGTYTNMGGLVVSDGEVAILKWDTAWAKEVTGAATVTQVAQLGTKVYGVPDAEISVTGRRSFVYTNYEIGSVIDLTNLGVNANFKYYISNIPESAKYLRINGAGGSSGRLWAFLDDDNVLLSVADANLTLSDGLVFVPATAKKVVININGAGSAYFVSQGDIPYLTEKLINKEIDSSLWENKIVSSTLYISNNASYKYSPAIAVHRGDRIVVNTAGANIGVICSCDAVGTLASALVSAPSSASTTIPQIYRYEVENDGYVRICYKASIDGSYVEIIDTSVNTWYHIVSLEKGVEELEPLAHSFLDASSWPQQLIAAATKYVSTNANYRASTPIKVQSGDIINVFSAGGGVALVTTCNSAGTLDEVILSTESTASTTENKWYSITIQQDGYVRICFKYSIEGSFAELMQGGGPVWKHINELQKDSLEYGGDIADIQTRLDHPHLKILVLGNSYAADSWMYVPFILWNYGITCELSIYYRGALSLQNLYNRWTTKTPTDTETEGLNAGTYNREYYYIDTRQNNRVWHYAMTDAALKSAKECVELKEWDIISMQQWSGYSIDSASYEPYANDIIELIRESLPTPYTLAWNMVCTRPAYDDIPASIAAHQAIYHREPIGLYLPYGTAVFNARTNPTLAALGDYEGNVGAGYPAHNFWCADGVHIQEGIPKYTAALAIVQGIFQKYFPLLSVLGDTLRPTDQLVHDWGNLEVRGACVGVTDGNCYLAQKCAIQAVKFPFEVTTIY